MRPLESLHNGCLPVGSVAYPVVQRGARPDTAPLHWRSTS